MLSIITRCGCQRAFSMKSLFTNLILVMFLFVHVEKIESSPDYRSLHEQLSMREKLNKINTKNAIKASAPIIAQVGKVFRHSLDKFTSSDHGDQPTKIHVSFKVNEFLPFWLSYNSHNNKLVGVPLIKDVGKLDVVIRMAFKNIIKTKKIQIEVRDMKKQSFCNDGNPSLTAAAILTGDLRNHHNGKSRVDILRKFADYLDVEMHVLNMAERKTDGSFDSSIITAGPGDRGPCKPQTGIVITWPVACGLGIPGDVTINKLKHSSGNNYIYEKVGFCLTAWYVYKTQYRYRRQAFPAATPVATPVPSVPIPKSVTSVISGTPVISPTPSIVVKKTSSVMKSTVDIIKPTPAPVTKPATTKPPTTERPTTKMDTTEKVATTMKTTEKPKVPTQKPTTKKPMTTTMEPKKTTMKPEKTTMKLEKTTMKPEKTTMKPEKTTMKPKVTTMKPVKVTTDMKKPMTIKPTRKDESPKLINSIDLISLFADQAYKLKIQRDLFEDDIDGDTYNLTLTLKKVVSQKLTSVDESWIFLDTMSKFLYILPNLSQSGRNVFAIQATDSSGNKQNAVFIVEVKFENVIFNNLFNVTIDADYNMFIQNAMNKVELIESIAKATDVEYQKLRTQRFYSGSVIINYASSDLRNDNGCNSIKAQQYKAKLEGSEFKDKMAPKYIVTETSAKNVAPNCGLTNARKSPTEKTKNEYKWWEVVLIPVIVIAVLLLVIGLIFFFLYRRKRRYEPQKEDKNTFLYQKKPVIFREEYEEKPEVMSLEPLILPNERAPVTNEPRTSTPDASSSASTDGEEKGLISKSTPPQTPPPHSPPRSPPYGRSPPPYSES